MNTQRIAACLNTIPSTLPELKATHATLRELIGEIAQQYADLRKMPEGLIPMFAEALQFLATTTVSLESIGEKPSMPTGIAWFEDLLNERRRVLALIEVAELRSQGVLFH